MERDLPNPTLVACARQIMDIPPEDEMPDEAEPLHITGFALGHAAVLLYLALHVLESMTPTERGLVGGAVMAIGLALALLIRGKVRTGLAMAQCVAPTSSHLAAKAEN